jgi:hypothetical protein
VGNYVTGMPESGKGSNEIWDLPLEKLSG